jgi:hypothetical protein
VSVKETHAAHRYDVDRTDVRIPVADGITLAATLYRPICTDPVPALLEALPYRKDDHLERDVYERFAREFGFAACRVDLRGTGSSEGRAVDEYPVTEVGDLTTVIEWLAARTWCNGSRMRSARSTPSRTAAPRHNMVRKRERSCGRC